MYKIMSYLLNCSKLILGLVLVGLIVNQSEAVNRQSGPEKIITIPKTGTNMLLKLIFLIDNVHEIDCNVENYMSEDKTHFPFWLHAWGCSKEDEVTLGPNEVKVASLLSEKAKVIIILRDPRSLVGALDGGVLTEEKIYQVIDYPGKFFSEWLHSNSYLKYHSFTELYEDYMRWADYPFTYVTRFEKLVGPKGGGTKEDQIIEIMNIANHIDKPISWLQACDIADKIFGGTTTFKTGKIDNWEKKFTPELYEFFLSKDEKILRKLGYLNSTQTSMEESLDEK